MKTDLESARGFAITLGHRAVQDVRRDGFRQLRNYVDMCAILAKKETQKRFFDYAQKLLERTDSLYYGLVRRLVEEVREEVICNVGINLGFDSLIYGASRIKAEGNRDTSWSNEAIADAEGLDAAVSAAENAGSFTWVFALTRPLTARTVQIIRNHPYSVFFVLADPALMTPETVMLLEPCVNAVELLFLHEPELTSEACEAARDMKHRKMFCGFLVELDEAGATQAMQPDWLDVLAQYSMFCIYARKPDMTEETSRNLHTQIVHSREEVVQVPLLLFDWEEDLRQIGAVASPGAVPGRCLPEGETFPLNLDY